MKSARAIPGRGVRPQTLAALAVVSYLAMLASSPAETPAQICDRLAGDTIRLDSIDGRAAVTACSDAVTAAPQDKHLQYEYARALERNGKRDQAKQIYQWIAGDGYAPAKAALIRLAGPLAGEAAERERFARKLDVIADIAARIARSTPRDHDDLSTVLAKTGKEPAKILAWVKANTRIVPYAGMLRGASGVLMDRAGNSLDRALLLADLLHRAGYNVRIARAQISQRDAEALRARFVTSAPRPVPPGVPDKAAILKLIGNDPRLDPKLTEKAVDGTIAGARKFNVEVQNLYEKVLPAVLQAIGNDPARDARLAADADAILRDHFWVQRQNGASWEDLDPDMDTTGKLKAASTFAPSETPSNLKHRVTLRLVLETLKDGKLSEAPLLQQSWLPSEISDKPIVISHALYPQVALNGLLNRPNPQADFVQSLADASVVMPTLQVGTQLTRGQIYDFTGRVEAPRPENLASMGGTAIVNGQSLSRGIASAFGDSTPAGPSQASVTAEWLEIEIVRPGRPPEKHRRAIFDLIGAAARANPASIAAPVITDELRRQRALALGATIDAYVFGATPSAEWIQRVAMNGTARTMALAAKTARTARSLDDASLQSANRLELQLWAWAANRAASSLLSKSVPDSANVALLWNTLAPQPNTSDRMQIAFDIVANGTVGDGTFAHRVAQGVLDTIIEHTTLGGDSTDVNAATLHAADIAAGKSWIMLRPLEGTVAANLTAPAEARAQMQTELAAGDIVVVPVSGANNHYAWWRIDPSNGETLGIGSTGMGDSMVEEAILLSSTPVFAGCVLFGIGVSIGNHVWVGAARLAMCYLNPVAGSVLSISKATGTPVTTVVEELASGAVSAGNVVLFGSK